MNKVLLTGATGFIGQPMISALIERGYVVHAVSSKSKPRNSEKLFWHQVDLQDSAQTEKLIKQVRPTHLVHLAWYVENKKLWNAPENLDWVKASLELLRVFVACGGKRAVMAGTCAEYDWSEQAPFSENKTSVRPQSLYGMSKHALHLIAEKFADVAGVSLAWGRIFFSFGEAESPNRLVASVIRSLLDGKEAKCTHGNQIRDFLSSADIAGAFAALLDSDVKGAVNIASGRGVKIKTLVETVAEIMGRTDLPRFGVIEATPNEPQQIIADVTRLREEVGFKDSTDLERRLSETVKWWKENKNS